MTQPTASDLRFTLVDGGYGLFVYAPPSLKHAFQHVVDGASIPALIEGAPWRVVCHANCYTVQSSKSPPALGFLCTTIDSSTRGMAELVCDMMNHIVAMWGMTHGVSKIYLDWPSKNKYVSANILREAYSQLGVGP